MFTQGTRRLLGATLSLLVCVAAFGQGMYWETTTTGGREGDNAKLTKTSYMPKLFKMENEDEGSIIIMHLDKATFYSINTDKKTYSEVTMAEIEQAMGGAGEAMNDAMAQMEAQMEEMSEQERDMMKKMMGNMMPGMMKEAKFEVNATGKKRTISGYACSEHVVKRNDKAWMTVWATKDVKGLDEMRKDFEEFTRWIASMNPMMPKGLANAMKEIKGFPIETLSDDSTKEVVTKIEQRAIAATEFEIPAGYKKVESDMKQGAR